MRHTIGTLLIFIVIFYVAHLLYMEKLKIKQYDYTLVVDKDTINVIGLQYIKKHNIFKIIDSTGNVVIQTDTNVKILKQNERTNRK